MGRLELFYLDLDSGWTLPDERVTTCSGRVGIKGGSESDEFPDPSLSSDPGGVVLAESSSDSSSSMGGAGFVFRLAGGLAAEEGTGRRDHGAGATLLDAGRAGD